QDFLFLTQKDAQTQKLGGLLMFDTKNKKFIDLGAFLSQDVEIEVSPQNEIFFLEKGGLYKIDANGTKKTLIDTDINGFLFEGDNFYYLKNNSLFVASSPGQKGEKIVGNLPDFTSAKIFINFNRQAYLLLDKTLYKVSNNLEKLAENISDINFNRADSSMAVVSGSEILRTRQDKEGLDFITRSREALYNPRLANKIDYCLFLKNNKIIALELDARDKQNEYILYEGKNILRFEVDASGENLTVLDGMELKNVKIR
ncbi:MAG: hypothetical protein NTX98_01580, partial [Candidatus Doudnabacteria bacterium]|nr:hypothetical protein [Candidatus Doudnabacteria bacterium]